jgi:hypothetical protein
VAVLVDDALRDRARRRLVLITTEAELPSVASAHRALAERLTRVFVPKPTSRDWLPIWFAQLPLVEHYADRSVALDTLLAAFASSPDDARARGDWRTVYDAILRVEVDALAELRWDPAESPHLSRWRGVVSMVKRSRELDASELAWIATWLGDEASLRAIIRAHAELHA